MLLMIGTADEFPRGTMREREERRSEVTPFGPRTSLPVL